MLEDNVKESPQDDDQKNVNEIESEKKLMIDFTKNDTSDDGGESFACDSVTEEVIEFTDNDTSLITKNLSGPEVVDKIEVTDVGSAENIMGTDVPRVVLLSSTDTQLSGSDGSIDEHNKWKKKKKNLSEKLSEANTRLAKELGISTALRSQLQEYSDAKERLENNLSDLQARFDKQLKEEEALRFELSAKDKELLDVIDDAKCKRDALQVKLDEKEESFAALQSKESKLADELWDIKNNLTDLNKEWSHVDDEPSPLHVKLKNKISEMENQLVSYEGSLAEKNDCIDKLNREIALLNERLTDKGVQEADHQTVHEDVKEERKEIGVRNGEGEGESSMWSDNETQLRSQISELEKEIAGLREELEEKKDKYNATLSEALSTLKEVQDAYGEMRDVVLEGYKQENLVLKDQLRIADETSNKEIITSLRAEILDLKLQLDRSKKAHKEDLNKLSEVESAYDNASQEIARLKEKLTSEQEDNLNKATSMVEIENLAEVRKTRITELETALTSLNLSVELIENTLKEKNELILELKNQLMKEAEVLTKEHAEKESLLVELEMMDSVKRRNQKLEEEFEEISHKVKLRGTKIKFMKKTVIELEDQKQKLDSMLSVIPELQKKIDEVVLENTNLKQQILNKKREDEERERLEEEKKKEEEENLLKEKLNWEKSILGIGKCPEFHDGEVEQRAFARPKSAPALKPRPPTAKRQAYFKGNAFRAPTLNPLFLQSYPEGKKASKKMKQHQEKIIFSSNNKIDLFRSSTKPMDYVSPHSHMAEEKYFPKIPHKVNGENAPRVLVWGDGGNGLGNRMVAVGDRVLVNLHSQCNSHGECSNQHAGIVKFIGFVEGNDDDVYIGLRLEENVGYTNGVIQGKRYFRSEPEKGAFVHLNDVLKVLQTQVKHPPSMNF